MKLLILAQTPPPLHGQSLMVETAVTGLPAHGIPVHHVNLRLSRSHADIGGWRVGKVLAILDACCHAIVARFAHGCDTLYYVPAPGKRGALYRDWLVMLLVRPFYRRLVLHFHNGGLGEWLATHATPIEHALTLRLLGRADLALVLAEALRADAEALEASRIAVVPNGIADPGPPLVREREDTVLFLGAITEEKGALDLLDAVRRLRWSGRTTQLVFAGTFEPAVWEACARAEAADRGLCRFAGYLAGEEKREALARCGIVCLPTHYAHEAQPLVALEALAAGAPLVATRWRALPETVPPGTKLVPPRDPEALAGALASTFARPPEGGVVREWFERRFARDRHLQSLADALREVDAAG